MKAWFGGLAFGAKDERRGVTKAVDKKGKQLDWGHIPYGREDKHPRQ